jgi:hypothetical protein
MNVKIIVLGFANARSLAASLERLEKTLAVTKSKITKKLLVGLGYPLPSKEKNREDLSELAAKHGFEFEMASGNNGQSGNIELYNKLLADSDDDMLIYYDADHDIEPLGWIDAVVDVARDEMIGMVTVNCTCEYGDRMQDPDVKLVNGHRVKQVTWYGNLPIYCIRGDVARRGIVHAPHKYYGHTEADVMYACGHIQKVGVMLLDFDDKRSFHGIDMDYQLWKHTHIQDRNQPSFEEFLRSKGMIP